MTATSAVPEQSPLGNRVHPLGRISKNKPIQPVPANTRYFEAGVLRLGFESRELDEDVIVANFGHDPAALAAVRKQNNYDLPEDEGMSLHVFDAASSQEILRFDMFDDGPHYHYLPRQGGYHIVVVYDVAANGDMFAWAARALRERAGVLLENAGWGDLVPDVDPELLDAALTEVEGTLSSLTGPIAGR